MARGNAWALLPPGRTALHTLIRGANHFANCVRYIRSNPRQRSATFRLHLDSPIHPVAKFLAMQGHFGYYS
jgi:hypothetical protein